MPRASGLNTQYNYSPPAYSGSLAPPLRRAALPFAHGSAPQFSNTDTNMDEIITSGSVPAASCPGFHAQDETMDTAIDMDDVLDDAKEEAEEEEQVEPEPGPKERKKNPGRASRQVDVQGRRVPRRSMEDRQHRPDHRLESERQHVLEMNQVGVR